MKISVVMVVGFLLFGCASVENKKSIDNDSVEFDECNILGFMLGPCVEPDLVEISKHSLGSKGNPIRVLSPSGERSYLKALRCADGRRPEFNRAGSVGMGPYGFMLDVYVVKCMAADGASDKVTKVYMDMYHQDYVETSPPNGFSYQAE